MGVLDPKLLQAKRLADAKRAALEQQEGETEKINHRCERGFEALLQAKMDAVQRGLIPFHHAFSELQNVSLEVDTGREDLPKIDEVTVAEIGSLQPSAVDVLGASAVAGMAGAAAYGATTTAVMAFATASTGTAISSLSGAAASNAALAWLGGGSLAAGGGGMAAGAVVLGAIAAVPTVAVGGFFLHQAGRKALAKAQAYAAEVDAAIARHREAQKLLKAADRMARDLRALLAALTLRLASETHWLSKQVEIEKDWTALSDPVKERIRAIATMAVAVSDLVVTTVVDEDGAITDAIRRAYDHGQTVAGAAAS
jgi:hypothetical protein